MSKPKTIKPLRKKKHHNSEEMERNNVYMFHHVKYDLHLFVNADGFDQAMMKFDLCGFEDRPNWKIFLECGNQPA